MRNGDRSSIGFCRPISSDSTDAKLDDGLELVILDPMLLSTSCSLFCRTKVWNKCSKIHRPTFTLSSDSMYLRSVI